MVEGRLTEWNDERGFGFITPLGGGERVFAHISAFRHLDRRPEVDDLVHYAAGLDDRGRMRAVDATRAHDAPGSAASSLHAGPRSVSSAITIACSFMLVVLVLTLVGRVPAGVLAAYVLLSVWLFVFYGIDKSAAQRRGWRAPESMLHLGAVLGGWPGALVAQSVFHHKTVKQPFRVVFWATVGLNCVALALFAQVWPHVPG